MNEREWLEQASIGDLIIECASMESTDLEGRPMRATRCHEGFTITWKCNSTWEAECCSIDKSGEDLKKVLKEFYEDYVMKHGGEC